MKRTILLPCVIFALIAIAALIVIAKNIPDLGSSSMLRQADAAFREFGFTRSSTEVIHPSKSYSDKDGNKIVFSSYSCSDPSLIKDETAVFYSKVFDPKSAGGTEEIEVSKSSAVLCAKEDRSYLPWYPNANSILMLDFDPNAVSLDEIVKMAESCK